jgi:hypothetical protein
MTQPQRDPITLLTGSMQSTAMLLWPDGTVAVMAPEAAERSSLKRPTAVPFRRARLC